VHAFLVEKNHSPDLVLKAGVAHLWFVAIHPFEDGSGRIARAIADMVLARSDCPSRRFRRKAFACAFRSTNACRLDGIFC
jgi:Fic family protein